MDKFYHIIFFIETNAKALFEKSASRTIASYTLENIKDSEFCQGASAVLSSIQESLLFIPVLKTFYNEVWCLELIMELLSMYHSNERICFNTLAILQSFISNLSRLCPNEKEVIRSFIEDGGFELTDKILTEHKDNMEIRIMCSSIVKALSISIKYLIRFSISQLFLQF